MSRSEPSAAIRAVVDDLERDGLALSARQIESLQRKGALPKGRHVHEGGGGSRIELPEDFLMRATIVARLRERSRTAANVAAALYVTGHPLTETDASAIANRARELLDQVAKGAADPGVLQDQIESSRSPGVRRARRTVARELSEAASVRGDDAPESSPDAVLAFELHSIIGLLSGYDDTDVDETIAVPALVAPALAPLVEGVVSELDDMLRQVGTAPEGISIDSLNACQFVWQSMMPDLSPVEVGSLDMDGLIVGIATTVGILGRAAPVRAGPTA